MTQIKVDVKEKGRTESSMYKESTKSLLRFSPKTLNKLPKTKYESSFGQSTFHFRQKMST